MNDDLALQTDKLREQIRGLAPEVDVRLTGEIFEDESANLEVYPPLSWTEQQCRELQRKTSDLAIDLLVETGHLVLIYVCKPEQLVIEAEHRLKRARQEVEAAERILAEADMLGIVPSAVLQAA